MTLARIYTRVLLRRNGGAGNGMESTASRIEDATGNGMEDGSSGAIPPRTELIDRFAGRVGLHGPVSRGVLSTRTSFGTF
jgi:hypothetical protein